MAATTLPPIPDDPLSVELGMEPPTPIEAPTGFPSQDELVPLLAVGIGERHYPRARIVSGWVGPENDWRKTITHYDDITVWDYQDGGREVETPEHDYLVQASDGSWVESDRFEWSIGDLFWAWDTAQEMAGQQFIEGQAALVGYEELIDLPTAHYTVSAGSPEEGGKTRTDVWIAENGAVIRLVLTTELTGPQDFEHLVWDVQTLDPVLEGPLPPSASD